LNINQDIELCCIDVSEPRRNVKSSNRLETGYSLAMSYIPVQSFDKTYQDSEALFKGTLFPELDKPFMRGRCRYDD